MSVSDNFMCFADILCTFFFCELCCNFFVFVVHILLLFSCLCINLFISAILVVFYFLIFFYLEFGDPVVSIVG